MATQVDAAIERINSHYQEVKGIIVCDQEGASVKSTMTAQETLRYSSKIGALTVWARSMIRELDHTNDLIFLRIRTTHNEIMIAPDDKYFLIVIQEIKS